ncbi:DUF3515 family protein [Demetria terragena]|uniref:DUF3515 family protein n=1 Tax=Demetria terragena TaxID=63959 RepID=UPI00036F1204|nr:DUF3515 family protein [Demetria terragena]
MHRRSRLIVGAVLTAGVATGCSSTVEVAIPNKAGDPRCASVAKHWPVTVAQQSAREVSSDSPAVRAWGDPPIVARCGLTSPGPTTDPCVDASGVDWVAHDLDDGTAFVTYGRDPAIEVLVPKDYAPEPLALGAFASAAKQIPQGEHRCTASGRAR